MRNINLPNILKPYIVYQQPLKFLLYEFSVLPAMEKGKQIMLEGLLNVQSDDMLGTVEK